MPTEIEFTLDEVSRVYAGRTVLDIPMLEIRRGELLALVGPSGSGKSTLLRLLNGLEKPDTGRIGFRDQPDLAALPLATRRQITTVFQHPRLLERSVEENVALGLRIRGAGRTAARPRVRELLDELGLAAHARAHAPRLSAGERQRVALARALAFEPAVLLLDEPTANLDPHNVSLLVERIRRERARRQLTVVLVTHNVFQARRLADRCALLLGGKLVEVGATQRFFEAPLDPRVSAFVRGEMVW